MPAIAIPSFFSSAAGTMAVRSMYQTLLDKVILASESKLDGWIDVRWEQNSSATTLEHQLLVHDPAQHVMVLATKFPLDFHPVDIRFDAEGHLDFVLVSPSPSFQP